MVAFSSARTTRALLLASALTLVSVGAWGQASNTAYPTKSIAVVVPFAPGGPNDLIARAVGGKMSESLGQPVVVENKVGATGVIGITYVQKAAPDGYTLLMVGDGPLAALPVLSAKPMPFDTLRDFIPISVSAQSPYVIAVNANSKFQTLKELIAYAKDNPGKVTYGSAGVGGAVHIAAEIFSARAGVKLSHIPYKGVGPAFVDLLGGQIDLVIGDLAPALPHMQSGRLRALAITTEQRSKLVPDLPTAIEAGLPGYSYAVWFGLVAPANTPPAIVARLSEEAGKAARNKEITEQFVKQGLEPIGSSAAEMTRMIEAAQERARALRQSQNFVLE
jgi:tripartite-type tricarboxylate transporter receptor subunit TctC